MAHALAWVALLAVALLTLTPGDAGASGAVERCQAAFGPDTVVQVQAPPPAPPATAEAAPARACETLAVGEDFAGLPQGATWQACERVRDAAGLQDGAVRVASVWVGTGLHGTEGCQLLDDTLAALQPAEDFLAVSCDRLGRELEPRAPAC